MLLACLAPGLAIAQPGCGQARAVVDAYRVVERGGVVLHSGAVGHMDAIAREWRNEDTHIRYRFAVGPCGTLPQQGLWVYRIGAPYRVSADGIPLLAVQPFAPVGVNVYNGRVPALFSLPEGAQSVEVELVGLPYMGHGLVRVELGSLYALHDARSLERTVLTQFNDVSSAIILLVGLLAILAWLLRRKDRQVLWLGVACLCWALRGLAYQTFAMPWDALAFEQLNPMLVLMTCAAITASTLYSLGAMTRRRGVALAALVLVVLAGFVLTWTLGRWGQLVRSQAFLWGFVMVLALVAMLWRQRRRRPRQIGLLLGGYVALVGGAAHDMGMVVGVVAPDHWSFITPGFTLMLLSYTVAVSRYLVHSLNRAERANDELERAIQAKAAQLEASYALLRDSEREAARTQEREHLLREMHDGLGAQLMTALRGVERGALAREQVLAALQDGLDDLRLLMDSTDIGRTLQGALAAWRNRWDPRLSALGLSLLWEVDDALDEVVLHPDAVLQVMRILQEATANVVKHAAATRMQLMVWREGSTLCLQVQDDGAGLPQAAPRAGARGLRNMDNRARLLGGTLVVEPVAPPQHGTRVGLRLPLGVAPAAQPS